MSSEGLPWLPGDHWPPQRPEEHRRRGCVMKLPPAKRTSGVGLPLAFPKSVVGGLGSIVSVVGLFQGRTSGNVVGFL